jgi:hypothetical protein
VMAAVLAVAQVDSGIWPSRQDRAGVLAAALVLVAGALAIAYRSGRLRLPMVPRPVAAAVLALAVLVAGYAAGDRYLDDRYASARVSDSALPRAVYGWARDASGARIALSNMFLQYPLAGTELSNRVQYLGLPARDGGFRPPSGCREWRAALAAGGYDYVITAPRGYPAQLSADDSPEAGWTRTDPGASEVMSDPGGVRLFRLERPPEPARCGSGS